MGLETTIIAKEQLSHLGTSFSETICLLINSHTGHCYREPEHPTRAFVSPHHELPHHFLQVNINPDLEHLEKQSDTLIKTNYLQGVLMPEGSDPNPRPHKAHLAGT